MLRNKTNILLFIFLQVFVVSCQKQSAPVVSPEDAWVIRDQARLEACSQVNFTKNLLRHKNTYFLFKCTGWDKTFPSLNRGIQNINPDSWNHFFKPVDDAFLNDRERRDRIFDHIRDLDSKRGLDDLSRVLTALNETNFYDGLRDLFLCSEKPNHQKCKERKGRNLSKDEIKSFISLVDIKPVVVKSVSTLIRQLMSSIGDDSDNLRDEIKKFFYKDEFIKIRLNLVSSLAQKNESGP